MGCYSLEEIYLILEGYMMAVCARDIQIDSLDLIEICQQLGVEKEEEIEEILVHYGYNKPK